MDPSQKFKLKMRRREPGLVSGRFLTEFFKSLERLRVPATRLLGDLPVPRNAAGAVIEAVEWSDFAEFMKRLERHVGGPTGLEACGERFGELRPIGLLQALVGPLASPILLYRVASQWALRGAITGIDSRIEKVGSNRIEIHMRLADGLRACPQLFHFTAGGARTLPRVLGVNDAVVTAHVEHFSARFEITLPASNTLWARLTRSTQSFFSASSVLKLLENQQMELHETRDKLISTQKALAASEGRHRAIVDAAVDVLCELDGDGRIVYVSPSVQELLGYSRRQVTGSHFSLWVPQRDREKMRKRFNGFASRTSMRAVSRERIQLQTEAGLELVATLSLRSYQTSDGELRMIGILRDESHHRQ